MKQATLAAILLSAAAMARAEVCPTVTTVERADSFKPSSDARKSAIPEPSTASLIGGFGLLLLLRRKH